MGKKLVFSFILFACLILATAYALNSPLYEPTDELRHVRYVRHIAVYHGLPTQTAEGPRAQSHHPPLYYALGALVSGWVPVEKDVYYSPPDNRYWGYRYWAVSNDNKNQYLHTNDERFPFRDIALAVYLMRGLNVLIGAGAVWLTYRAGRTAFPKHAGVAIAGAAIVAFNPQFIYLSAAVNNDVLAAFFGAATLWACARLIQHGPCQCLDVTLGFLYGLALLTKFHLLALLAPIGLSYLIAVWPAYRPNWHKSLKRITVGLVTILGLAILVSGWWFTRNYILYGDPTGMNKVNELWAGRPADEYLWAVPQSFPYLWSSLWGRFGYGQIPMPQVIYDTILVFCAVSILGYAIPRRSNASKMLTLLVALPLTFVAVVSYYILIQPAGAMGRFLFPALPAFALLITRGFSRIFPHHLIQVAHGIITIGMLALAVYALAAILAPAYARPTSLNASETEAIPNRSYAVQFGEVARLLGYQVSSTQVKPGETIDVTVYWQALKPTDRNYAVDYAVFVHLLSEPGTIMVAQRDTYPGLGRYPTSIWEPGVIFADTYRLFVPAAAYAPDQAYVQVGLYLPNGPRLATPDGRDAVRLATVAIAPHPGEIPNPLNVNFGDQIILAGYRLDRRAARPGEEICLTLYWQAQVGLQKDYRIFAHVLGTDDQVWANTDSLPVVPTSQWQPSDIVHDVRCLKVGETTPPNFYDIEIGIYRPGDSRLRVVAADGRPIGKSARLSKIRVMAPSGSELEHE